MRPANGRAEGPEALCACCAHCRLCLPQAVPAANGACGGAADGRWPLAGPLAPMMKPGGHGAIWKLMLDEGIFAWLAAHRREAALVRQIRCKELPVLVSGLDLRAFGCGRALLSTTVTRDRAPQAALSRGGHVSLLRRPVALWQQTHLVTLRTLQQPAGGHGQHAAGAVGPRLHGRQAVWLRQLPAGGGRRGGHERAGGAAGAAAPAPG